MHTHTQSNPHKYLIKLLIPFYLHTENLTEQKTLGHNPKCIQKTKQKDGHNKKKKISGWWEGSERKKGQKYRNIQLKK